MSIPSTNHCGEGNVEVCREGAQQMGVGNRNDHQGLTMLACFESMTPRILSVPECKQVHCIRLLHQGRHPRLESFDSRA